MDFDLKKLTDWSRRACGDRAKRTREEQVSIGDNVFVLANDGGVAIMSVTVDKEPTSDFTLTGNVITFSTAPVDSATVVFTYTYTRYTDTEVNQFLADAAEAVAADTNIPFAISKTSYRITADPTIPTQAKALTPDKTDFSERVKALIVYRAALDMYGDKANTAADKAITVKDGDTMIDTSKTSGASEKAVERVLQKYKDALKVFRSEVFAGRTGEIFQEQVVNSVGMWGKI